MNPPPNRSAIGHIPMLWLVVPQIIGYTLAVVLPDSGRPAIWVGGSLGLLIIAYFRLQKSAQLSSWSPFYLVGAVLLAVGYYQWRQPAQPHLEHRAPREADIVIDIDRVVRQASSSDAASRVSIYAKVIACPAHLHYLSEQKIFFSMYPDAEAAQPSALIRGAHYRVRGLLKYSADPQATDLTAFQQFLSRNGYYYRLQRARIVQEVTPAPIFYRWCDRQNQHLQRIARKGSSNARERELASIFTAMMLGIKGAIPPQQKDNFRISGTLHLFAISGLHVGIIAATLYILLSIIRVPLLPRCVIALCVLWLYVQITGASPSAIRAFSMAFFYWAALGVQRKPSTFSALLASAFAVLVYEPQQLLSVGFQLSYTVVTGLLLYGQPLIETLQNKFTLFRFTPEDTLSIWQKAYRHVWQAGLGLLGMSIAAFFFSTPLSLAYFHVFAPASVLLNLLLIPLATLVIIGGSLSFLCGILALSWLTIVFNHAAWLIILTMTTCLEYALLATWGFGTIDAVSLSAAVICECCMFSCLLGLYFFKRQHSTAFFATPPLALLLMGLLSL